MNRFEELKIVELGEKIGYKKGFEDARKQFERPHGEWIEDSDDYDVRCSSCGITCHALNKSNHLRLNLLTGGKWWTFYRFCPNCGASMLTKESDENG